MADLESGGLLAVADLESGGFVVVMTDLVEAAVGGRLGTEGFARDAMDAALAGRVGGLLLLPEPVRECVGRSLS